MTFSQLDSLGASFRSSSSPPPPRQRKNRPVALPSAKGVAGCATSSSRPHQAPIFRGSGFLASTHYRVFVVFVSYTTSPSWRYVPGGPRRGDRCALGCVGREAGLSSGNAHHLGSFARLPRCPLPKGEDVLSILARGGSAHLPDGHFSATNFSERRKDEVRRSHSKYLN
jgi:hypothetical protein